MTTILDDGINSIWAATGLFSPDGHWLALIDDPDLEKTEFRPLGQNLYLVQTPLLVP